MKTQSEKIKNKEKNPLIRLLKKVSWIIATGFGAGKSPLAPGTVGSLVAFPILFFTRDFSFEVLVLIWFLYFLVALWATKQVLVETQSQDPGFIVVDEILGQAIACSFFFSFSWIENATAFFLFRVFDVLKIYPVSILDQGSKKWTGWLGAFGVIADDLIAGCQSLILLNILKKWHFTAHFFSVL